MQKQGLVKLTLFLFRGLFFVTKIPQMPEDFQPGFEIKFDVRERTNGFNFIPEKSRREK